MWNIETSCFFANQKQGRLSGHVSQKLRELRNTSQKAKGDHYNGVVEPPATSTVATSCEVVPTRFMDLSAELRMLGYDHLLMIRVYTTAASNVERRGYIN